MNQPNNQDLSLYQCEYRFRIGGELGQPFIGYSVGNSPKMAARNFMQSNAHSFGYCKDSTFELDGNNQVRQMIQSDIIMIVEKFATVNVPGFRISLTPTKTLDNKLV